MLQRNTKCPSIICCDNVNNSHEVVLALFKKFWWALYFCQKNLSKSAKGFNWNSELHLSQTPRVGCWGTFKATHPTRRNFVIHKPSNLLKTLDGPFLFYLLKTKTVGRVSMRLRQKKDKEMYQSWISNGDPVGFSENRFWGPTRWSLWLIFGFPNPWVQHEFYENCGILRATALKSQDLRFYTRPWGVPTLCYISNLRQ